MRFWPAVVLTATLLMGQRGTPASLTITAASRSVQPGELVVLTVVSAGPLEAIRAPAFDRALLGYQSDPRTWTLLVGIDLDVKPGTYTVTIESGASRLPTARHTGSTSSPRPSGRGR